MKKITCLYVFLFMVVLNAFSQEKYSRVKIYNPNEKIIHAIATEGVDLKCGSAHEGEFLILELSETEIKNLKKKNIPFNIEIEDLEKFYSERATRDLPRANTELRADQARGSMQLYMRLDRNQLITIHLRKM